MDIQSIIVKNRVPALSILALLFLAWWAYYHRIGVAVSTETSAPGAASMPVVGGGGGATVGAAGAVNLGGLNLQTLQLPGYSGDTSGLMASLTAALNSAKDVTAAISAPTRDPGSENMFPLFGYGVPGQAGPARTGVPAQVVQPAPAYVAAKTAAPPRIAPAPKAKPQAQSLIAIDPWRGTKVQATSVEQYNSIQNEFNAQFMAAQRSAWNPHGTGGIGF